MALTQWLENSHPRLILAAFLVTLAWGGACNCDDPDDPDPDVGIDVIDDVIDDVDDEEDVDDDDVVDDEDVVDEEDVDVDPPDIPDGMARVQFVHNVADPAGATVDVYLNDALSIDDFDFRTATPFIDLDAGTYDVVFAPDDSDDVDDGFQTFEGVEFSEGVRYLVIASGVVDPDDFTDNPDDIDIALALYSFDNALEESVDPGVDQMVLFHGATDAPAVDLQVANETIIVDDLSYGEFSDGYLTLPPGVTPFDILVHETGDRVNSYQTPDLSGGEAYVAVASGFLDDTQNPDASFAIVVYPTPVGGDRVDGIILEEAARAQIVHDSVDPAASPIDIFLNGTLLAEGVSFRTATPFLTVAAGQDLTVAITAAGAGDPDDDVLSETFNLESGSANYIIASGVLDSDAYADNPDGEDVSLDLYAYTDAREAAEDDGVDVIAFHSVIDAGDVAVVATNGEETLLVDSFRYGSFGVYETISSDDGTIIEIRDADDDSLIIDFEFDLSDREGDALLMVISGLADPDAADDEDAPGLEVYVLGADGTIVSAKDE